jgi:alpha-tubulin suppressor-like RCC1 family protein
MKGGRLSYAPRALAGAMVVAAASAAGCNGLLGIDEASLGATPGGEGGGAAFEGAGGGGGAAKGGGAGGGAGAGGAGAGGGGPTSRARGVGAGFQNSCAVVESGQVYCWGANAQGELGDGTTDGRPRPRPVVAAAGDAPLTNARALATGSSHSCALVGEGGVRCWGGNSLNQLGDGTTEVRTAAVVVSSGQGAPLAGVQAVASGQNHACALAGGGLLCWGLNGSGQLGDGTRANRGVAAPVLRAPATPLAGALAVACGGEHSCAVVGAGEVHCWGGNANGELGDGTTVGRDVPAPVVTSVLGPPLAGVQVLALGSRHGCAAIEGGNVRCWGDNEYGQLGDGTGASQTLPVAVATGPGGGPLAGALALALGSFHSCAVVAGGEVRCWGRNASGELGDGTTSDRPYPVPVLASPGGPPLTGVRALALGPDHSCAVTEAGEALCWGSNPAGQLGDATTSQRRTPVRVVLP